MNDTEGIVRLINSNDYQEGYGVGFSSGYQQGRADRNNEILSQLSEQINYWDECSNAVEKGGLEYKIYTSLYRTICELYEQIKEQKNE